MHNEIIKIEPNHFKGKIDAELNSTAKTQALMKSNLENSTEIFMQTQEADSALYIHLQSQLTNISQILGNASQTVSANDIEELVQEMDLKLLDVSRALTNIQNQVSAVFRECPLLLLLRKACTYSKIIIF